MSIPSVSWMDRAACVSADLDHDAWHPSTAAYTSDNVEAVRLCRTCPVSDECLAFAVAHNLEHGIFGGLTGEQRKAMRTAAKVRVSVRKVEGMWQVSDGEHEARAVSAPVAWHFAARVVA
jgi:WhiB family transcriptional regulator, redox-sensing transcriptional regulator